MVKSNTLSGMLAAVSIIQVKVLAYPESLATNCIPHAWSAIGGAVNDAAAMMTLASASIAASVNSSSKFDPHSMILAARWFGSGAWPMDNDPSIDPYYIQTMHQIQGAFDRASVLLFTETINFFCYDFCEFRIDDKKTTNDLPPAYVRPGFGAPLDGITRIIRPEPNISDTTIGICPQFWNEKTYVDLPDAEVDLAPASTIIHAMMLLPGAGQSLNIIDVETHTAGKFDSDRKNTSLCLGPAKSQWLAWQNTSFALHNADNYANFALDVTLQSFYVDELAEQEFPKERLDGDEAKDLRLKLVEVDHKLEAYLAAHARWESESTVMVIAPSATVQRRSAAVTPFPIITRATAHNMT